MDVFWKICTQTNLRVLEWGEPDWPVCQGSVWPLKPLKQNVHRSSFCTEADTHTMHWLRSFGVVWWGGGKGEWQAKCQLDLHSSVYQATSLLLCTGMIAALGMTMMILTERLKVQRIYAFHWKVRLVYQCIRTEQGQVYMLLGIIPYCHNQWRR